MHTKCIHSLARRTLLSIGRREVREISYIVSSQNCRLCKGCNVFVLKSLKTIGIYVKVGLVPMLAFCIDVLVFLNVVDNF